MESILHTNRLILREFKIDDAEFIFSLNQDPEVLQYTGDTPFFHIKEAEDFLNSYTYKSSLRLGRWIMIDKNSSTALGWCGLKLHDSGMVDLGFRLLKKHWNQGYATEAAMACLEYGFMSCHLETIVGRVARMNTASIRVLEKIGMKLKESGECEGIKDALIYQMNSREYRDLKNEI